jgi:phage N-6-adenine-methyltransferase
MANDLWRTPKEVFNYFDRRYDFQCDVAASDDNHLCDSYITEKENALTLDWGASLETVNYGSYVWCNPPYSNPLPWVIKCISESEHYGIGSVMLLNCDMSVEWSSLLVNLECKIIHSIASGSKKDKTYRNGRIAFLNENNQPVGENNKAQVIFIIPPYVRAGEPVTVYLPLVNIMEDDV